MAVRLWSPLKCLPPLVSLGAPWLLGFSLLACGGSDETLGRAWNGENGDFGNSADAGSSGGGSGTSGGDVPETESFVVRDVAATSGYVFIPNASPQSASLAVVDGRDFSVRPVAVGLEPSEVRAAEIEGQGAVGFVLCRGASLVAVVRPDVLNPATGEPDVRLLPVPSEVNALALSPDGRHLLAYIDPTKPMGQTSSVASLQTMALVRLGDAPGEDRVFELSVTRLISDVQFSGDGRLAFVMGREGVNRIELGAVERDSFVAPLPFTLSDDLFDPGTQEVHVGSDGSYLVVRSSRYAGVAVVRLDGSEGEPLQVVALGAVPTDLDLVEREGGPLALVTLGEQEALVALDIRALLAGSPAQQAQQRFDVAQTSATLAQILPGGTGALVYSTRPVLPFVGHLDFATGELTRLGLRNQLKGLAISADAATVVALHQRQTGPLSAQADALEHFQKGHGLTLIQLATGYRRPVLLPGEPRDIVAVGGAVYAMVDSGTAQSQGLVRLDLATYRLDFVPMAKKPVQMGLVAGKVFVHQASPSGRITFFDPATGAQRTVSGYELNAGIQ